MPPTPPDQAPETRDGVHPLLRSFASETSALLLRLLAYLCIPAVLVLIGMELWSASQGNLAELIDSAAKTFSSKEAGGVEAPSKQITSGAAGDRTPAPDTVSEPTANQQTPPAAAPAPAPRDQMRRQRLLEPTKNRTDASCQDLQKGQDPKEKGPAKAERGRCDRTAAADGIDAEGALQLRGRI